MRFQENQIAPSSPSQAKPFLNPKEEILYIGSAKEKIGINDRERVIALSDVGRFLIMQSEEAKRHSNTSSICSSLRSSFASGGNRNRGSSMNHHQHEVLVESPRPRDKKRHRPRSTSSKPLIRLVKNHNDDYIMEHNIIKGESEGITESNTKKKSYMVIQNVLLIYLGRTGSKWL
eukprot:NODE_354_length_8925_cov_1.106050.p6 type:complete len:175 gc:universal NODE_354_length_8925_cov_1.106050:3212-3736(+)